jgi:hypothetical protein
LILAHVYFKGVACMRDSCCASHECMSRSGQSLSNEVSRSTQVLNGMPSFAQDQCRTCQCPSRPGTSHWRCLALLRAGTSVRALLINLAGWMGGRQGQWRYQQASTCQNWYLEHSFLVSVSLNLCMCAQLFIYNRWVCGLPCEHLRLTIRQDKTN